MSASSTPLLEARSLTRRHPGVTALDRADFSISPGEIVGLMGASGSGKSTLLLALAGLLPPAPGDRTGAVLWRGRDITRIAPHAAAALGIALAPQHPDFPPALTVADALSLGREPTRPAGVLDRAAMTARARTWLARLGFPLDPALPAHRLSAAQTRIVALARALAAEPSLLLLDNPTSALRPQDTDKLFETLGDLQARGTAIVFASDRLGEIQALATRVVVLRDGRIAGQLDRAEVNPESVHRLRAGQTLDLPIKELIEPGIVRLRADHIRTRAFPEADVSFSIREGEIVGMAGLAGSGRTSILRALFGLDARCGGSVALNDFELPSGRPDAALAAGAMFVDGRATPDDANPLALRDSLVLARLPRLSAAGIVSQTAADRLAVLLNDHLSITQAPLTQPLARLTPGQRRKAAIAQGLALQPTVALLDAPTRGVPLDTRAEIYECLERLAERGAAVLFASDEIDELLRLPDRLLVFREGALAGSLTREDDFTERGIMLLAAPQTPRPRSSSNAK